MKTEPGPPVLDSAEDDELSSLFDMAWAEPEYTEAQVDAAGEVLIGQNSPEVDAAGEPVRDAVEELEHALEIINNWRSSHSFPLNTFQNGLRGRTHKVDPKGFVAQRVKRLSSIEAKLRRFDWLKMSKMQDIGGCRAVVSSVRRVGELVTLYKSSAVRHEIDDEDDYIQKPKGSGYRGIHLIYRYVSDRSKTYNGLKIEIQFRSVLQHAWATAVETVDTFEGQALKSGRGEREWRRFFALMGSAIARRERTPPVPNTPIDGKELVDELRQLIQTLDVERRLRAYAYGLQTVASPSTRGAHSFLLELDPASKRVKITGYTLQELAKASEELAAVEREIKESSDPADAVLVSVESMRALRRAYPNYYLDTRLFIRTMDEVMGGTS